MKFKINLLLQGQEAARDIVQFVPFRDHVSARSGAIGDSLTSAVLAEIPDQLYVLIFHFELQSKLYQMVFQYLLILMNTEFNPVLRVYKVQRHKIPY